MVASRGPIPKRTEVRRRANASSDGLEVSRGASMPSAAPEPAPYWHEMALEIYESMCESGQSVYWEQSDYAVLWLMCDQLHALYQPQFLGMQGDGIGIQKPFYGKRAMTASEIGAIMKTLGGLGATEGDRRRMRIELQKDDGAVRDLPKGVVAFDRARRGRKPKEASA